ncbi:MAG: RsmB/NOP family class I SAM-dependent RNA methyltransferase [Lachnospiraceae bacterium]|nr:RsmB/NOP family class I SAM-dependent RNA methyltransferase [Lachnospiraceae bacterium]
MRLPQEFADRMKKMLTEEEFSRYVESLDKPRYNGIRVNKLKMTPEEFLSISPFDLKPIPWCSNGFYYNREENPAKHPYYYAGLYYIQEPSAMTPASFLPVEPGDKVLDLCAAPGGKTTELGGKLQKKGVLVSNDISISRTKALLHNIEMAGIPNVVVLSEEPAKLAARFEGYFDKILVDAPCSGEGMFRKDPMMIKEWSPDKVEKYGALQKEIVSEAVKMLKPGGMMIYSTCTFAPEENEQTIEYLLERNEDLSLVELPMFDGFDHGHPEWSKTGREDLVHCRRLWPHRMEGEGHFVALLQKSPDSPIRKLRPYQYKKGKLAPELVEFLEESHLNLDPKRMEIYEERVFYMPEDLPDIKGLRIVRAGLFLGNLKKKRFEPSQPLAMAFGEGEGPKRVNLSVEDERLIRYLKCETIPVEADNGNVLICVENQPLGFGKVSNGTLKNKYRPSWRWMRG